MALKTAGTKLTTGLQAIQWQPSGMNQTDLAALIALMRAPVTGEYGAAAATSCGYIENGLLYAPSTTEYNQGIKLHPGDWIMVDGAGWPIVVPSAVFATSWQHS